MRVTVVSREYVSSTLYRLETVEGVVVYHYTELSHISLPDEGDTIDAAQHHMTHIWHTHQWWA